MIDFLCNRRIAGGGVNDSDVEAILIAQLATNRGATGEEVRLELARTGAIDSLEGLELAIEAERTFGISVSDDELSSVCRSIPDMVGLVRSKLASAGEAEGEAGR